MKISMKLVHRYIALIVTLSPTSNHLSSIVVVFYFVFFQGLGPIVQNNLTCYIHTYYALHIQNNLHYTFV